MIEVPKITQVEKRNNVARITQNVTDQVVQQQTQTIEVERPTIIQKTIQRRKPVIQEQIQQVPKIVEEVQTQIKKVQRTVEVPQIQYVKKIVDVPAQRTVEVPQIQKVQKLQKEVPL